VNRYAIVVSTHTNPPFPLAVAAVTGQRVVDICTLSSTWYKNATVIQSKWYNEVDGHFRVEPRFIVRDVATYTL
jgi:hypothetical protein